MTSQTLLIGFVGGIVLGATMQECDTHGHTNFVFVERNGRVIKVCKKCELGNKMYEETRD